MKIPKSLANFGAYISELGLRGAIGIAVQRRLRRPVLRIRVRGIRTPILCRENDSDFGVLRQILGRGENSNFAAFSPSRILDVGANVGYAALAYHRLFPDAEIVSVEPDEENLKWLRLNTEGIPRHRIVAGGLWSSNTTGRISNLEVSSCARQVTESASGKVSLFTVDRLLEDLSWPSVDLLKLDIEGAEAEVLDHCESWLPRVRWLCVELHDSIDPRCSAIFLGNVASKASRRWRSGEYEYVELRK